MMKKAVLILWMISIALALIGAGYIIFNGGRANAGYACVPMVFSLVFAIWYGRMSAKEDKDKKDETE